MLQLSLSNWHDIMSNAAPRTRDARIAALIQGQTSWLRVATLNRIRGDRPKADDEMRIVNRIIAVIVILRKRDRYPTITDEFIAKRGDLSANEFVGDVAAALGGKLPGGDLRTPAEARARRRRARSAERMD